MTKKNSSPDWFARGVAGLSIILSGIGLYFTYTSNNWQKATYEESQEDRVSVRLGIYRSAKYKGNNKLVPNPAGRVTVEIVNIGVRPLYIKGFLIQPEGEPITLGITERNKPPERLEPGEAHYFRINWDFSKHPLKEFPPFGSNEKDEKVAVMVETTRKTISLPVTPRFESI